MTLRRNLAAALLLQSNIAHSDGDLKIEATSNPCMVIQKEIANIQKEATDGAEAEATDQAIELKKLESLRLIYNCLKPSKPTPPSNSAPVTSNVDSDGGTHEGADDWWIPQMVVVCFRDEYGNLVTTTADKLCPTRPFRKIDADPEMDADSIESLQEFNIRLFRERLEAMEAESKHGQE